MTKYVFVTGGVVSGLGKGITASSIALSLKSRGYKVFMQKLDPYINVDPGTMNPIQHGEVFVTYDGCETDLDLGHYERFIDERLTKESSVTSGKIYSSVLEKERKFVKKAVSLDELFERVKEGHKEINIVLKTDSKGSEEAVKNALEKIDVEGVKVSVIRSGVGTITESDIVLASASNAIIIGFNVVPSSKTKEAAKNYNVDIRLYNIIYKVVEEIEAAMKGMLDPEFEEVVTGEAEIRQIFKFSKVGNIAGVHVTSGIIKAGSEARLIRDGVVITTTKIATLQREKDSAKEVKSGFDCGLTLENYSDIKVGDTVETFELKVVKK